MIYAIEETHNMINVCHLGSYSPWHKIPAILADEQSAWHAIMISVNLTDFNCKNESNVSMNSKAGRPSYQITCTCCGENVEMGGCTFSE